MGLLNFLFGGVGLTVVVALIGVARRQLRKPVATPPYRFARPGIEELKARSRILVVDDKDFEYLELLRQNGYEIDKQDDIASIESIITNDYAVVLLDLYGIGKEFSSKDHGLAVLAALRARSPSLLIAVYSASRWDIGQQQQYSRHADAVIDKARASFADFSALVDKLLLESVDTSRYTTLIKELSGIGLTEGDLEAIRKILVSTSPHDIDARMNALTSSVPRLSALSGERYGELRDVIAVATKRMRPWTTSL